MLATFQAWVDQLGGVGLFIIATLDSSFLSLPEVNDVLVIYLSTRHPDRMPYYAGMTTPGLPGRLLSPVRSGTQGRRGVPAPAIQPGAGGPRDTRSTSGGACSP